MHRFFSHIHLLGRMMLFSPPPRVAGIASVWRGSCIGRGPCFCGSQELLVPSQFPNQRHSNTGAIFLSVFFTFWPLYWAVWFVVPVILIVCGPCDSSLVKRCWHWGLSRLSPEISLLSLSHWVPLQLEVATHCLHGAGHPLSGQSTLICGL